MAENSLEMGWAAAPIKKQHPALSDKDAEHFDRDNQDLSRLRVRGLISDTEIRAIRRRYVKSVEGALRRAHATSKKDQP